MRRILALNLLLATALTAPAAHASVVLIANGSLSGSTDLSGLTAPLENGLPGNILGGLGSGLAYAGGNTFLALPDRGPNATPYNSAVDDTVSYISRFQTVTMALTPSAPGSALPYRLTPTLTKTTLLSSPTALTYGSGAGLGVGPGAPSQNTAGTYYFTGRSDNFGAGNSGDPANARFDPESIRVSNDGKSVFISDEYGPYVRQFDRATGQLIKTFALPGNLDVAKLSPNGGTEISGNTSGRVANKGMEGLALTPDGKTLVGIMQAPLIQDAADPATKNLNRIVTIDIASGTTHEYGYTPPTGQGISEIVAVNDHEFLVDERDGKGLGAGSDAKIKQVFKIDISGATDITTLSGTDAAEAAVAEPTAPFLDLVAALKANGISANQIPAKIEGLAFGPDVLLSGILNHTLFIANDNDFVPSVAGPNQFFVFGFQDGDLPGFEAQSIVSAVPLPAGLPLFAAALGILGVVASHTRGATRGH